jgi:hypothetical protein
VAEDEQRVTGIAVETFGKWLTRQYMKPGAVGELAYKACITGDWPIHAKARCTYRDYLADDQQASREELKAFDKAWEIWVQERADDR